MDPIFSLGLMAENKKIMTKKPWGNTGLRPISFIGLLCSVAILSGCGDSKPTSRISSLEDNDTTQEAMADSVSHMDTAAGEADDAFVVTTPPRTVTRSSLNPKNLFGKNLKSESERLDRLERAVQDLRHEFDMTMPSIKRLMAVEGDIQELIVELRKMSEDPSLASPAPRKRTPASIPQPVTREPQPLRPDPVAEKPTPPKTYQNKSAPPVQNGTASVYDIRIGEHPGKTRIVLDTNAKMDFSTDIDNGEKIMIIELPNAGWSARESQSFAKSSFISSYKVEPSGDGQMVIFQLKREARISYQQEIGSANGSGRRIVIDLSGG